MGVYGRSLPRRRVLINLAPNKAIDIYCLRVWQLYEFQKINNNYKRMGNGHKTLTFAKRATVKLAKQASGTPPRPRNLKNKYIYIYNFIIIFPNN